MLALWRDKAPRRIEGFRRTAEGVSADAGKRYGKGGNTMFSKTDFWIGLAVGAVAGIFGYRFMQERTQQLAAIEAGTADLSLAELQRQKEELEDLIAAQAASEK